MAPVDTIDPFPDSQASDVLRLEDGGYVIDVLVQGYPGKSVHNGGLGWSTVVLLRGHGRVVLIDAGNFGLRKVLTERLAELGIKPGDITDLILSHSHYDHIVNFPLFANATYWMGRVELEWALGVPWGTTVVPELYVRELSVHPRLRLVEEGDEVIPNIRALLGPGHTPGHLVFVLDGQERDVIFLQDAVKTRTELVSGDTDMTYDAAVSRRTVEMVWTLWRKRPGNILIPGHDLAMRLDGDVIELIGRRKAGITATFGETLQDVTRFALS